MWNESSIAEFWQRNKADFVADITASEIVRLSNNYIKGKVLDIGAGSGALVDRLVNAIGVDIVPKHPKVVRGTISELPFPGCSFDTVFATDILEHLPDGILRKGLSEVARVLNNEGRFIIVVPYKENLKQSSVWCPNCHSTFHRWGHIQVFDEHRIRVLLSHYNFRVIDMKVLPIGLMAKHWLVRYFWKLFVYIGFVKANSIFVVGGIC